MSSTTTPTERGTVLVVDDTPANLSLLLDYLPQHGFKVLVARDGQQALEQVQHARPDLILLDVIMPGLDGFETCRRFKANPETKEIPIIFMTSLSDTTDKIRGFETGAVDYVTKPFQQEEVLARVSTHLTLRQLQVALQDANNDLERRVTDRTAELQRALREVEQLKTRLETENLYLQEEIRSVHDFDEIIGNCPSLVETLRKVERVASTDSTVLILGETGSGKELIARAVHDRSRRSDRALVKVNCGAIAPGLIESELFGHVRGAFTGAVEKRVGRFEVADGGTIFLDEVGELTPEAQVKLLRVLQEREFEPLGSSRTVRVDMRVIAATNRDLEKAVSDGSFRADLFYRLNVFPIEVPPLRKRASDIPSLTRFFLSRLERRLGKPIPGCTEESLGRMSRYSWPGNVRELENVLERSAILAQGPVLNVEIGLPEAAPSADPEQPPAPAPGTLDDVQRLHIQDVLRVTGGVVEGAQGAAKILGLHPNTLRSRMKKLGIPSS